MNTGTNQRPPSAPVVSGAVRPTRRGRFNSLQRAMLLWNDLHPYNAVHVVRIAAPLDTPFVRTVIQNELERLGLARLHLAPSRSTFHYQGGPDSSPLEVLPPTATPDSALCAEIERQINSPFALDNPINPFRFFALDRGSAFDLGLAYLHPVADADAIARLLLQMAATCEGRTDPAPSSPPNLYPPRHDSLFRQSPLALLRKLAALPAALRLTRQSLRPPCTNLGDLQNGFTSFSLTPQDLQLLVETARAQGMTLHDLFLALLLRSIAPLASASKPKRQRRNITLGTIVNLRKDLGPEHQDAFGLCLGFFKVTHPAPQPDTSVLDLAQSIHRQTRRIKQRRLYLGTPLELALGRWILQFYSASKRKDFFRKNYPLWGGITNMNLNPLCDSAGRARPADYLRAVSTGPVTPLVLSITTVHSTVNISLSHRKAVYTDAQVQSLKQRFLESLHTLRSRP